MIKTLNPVGDRGADGDRPDDDGGVMAGFTLINCGFLAASIVLTALAAWRLDPPTS